MLGLALWNAPAVAATTYKIHGTLQLTDTSSADQFGNFNNTGPWNAHASCDGSTTTGYTDVVRGANVVVKNGSGKIVGVGALSGGHAADTTDCDFKFTVRLPKASFYQFGFGSRGSVTVSFNQLKRHGWRESLSLGS